MDDVPTIALLDPVGLGLYPTGNASFVDICRRAEIDRSGTVSDGIRCAIDKYRNTR